MKRILLLEDDISLGKGIAMALSGEGRTVVRAERLDQAEQLLDQEPFSLLILDINLPDGSGLDLLRRLRQRGSPVPVILLTANDLETDIVSGLELGADDYITKPFSLAVLRARVNNQLRRDTAPAGGRVELPPFSLDFSRMVFTREGQPVELSRTEQRLLRLLVDNRGQVLPRELLLERVWDGGQFVDGNALSVAMRRLRTKLVDAPIRTVYGLGYTWEGKR